MSDWFGHFRLPGGDDFLNVQSIPIVPSQITSGGCCFTASCILLSMTELINNVRLGVNELVLGVDAVALQQQLAAQQQQLAQLQAAAVAAQAASSSGIPVVGLPGTSFGPTCTQQIYLTDIILNYFSACSYGRRSAGIAATKPVTRTSSEQFWYFIGLDGRSVCTDPAAFSVVQRTDFRTHRGNAVQRYRVVTTACC